MSSSPTHRQPSSQRSPERQPQVVVRAGKHYVCSACGTWVEIPADVVGQLVIAVDPAPQPAEPSQDKPPQEDAKQAVVPPESSQTPASEPQPKSSGISRSSDDGHTASSSSVTPTAQQPKPARPRQPKIPPRESYAGQTIDGLIVPTAGQLDRALNWVTFHLTVLDRQGAECNRLRKLLKKQRRHYGKAKPDGGIQNPPSSKTNAPVISSPPRSLARKSLVRLRQRNELEHAGRSHQAIRHLTRWHRKSATLARTRQMRTWKRLQGRGPP